MKQKLINLIQRRIGDELSNKNPVKFLRDIKIEDIYSIAVSSVYLYTRSKKGAKKVTLFVEVISVIGHGIRDTYKLKKDSALAAKAGAFVLYSFEQLGIIKVIMTAAGNGHQTYAVDLIDEDALDKLWENLDGAKIEKLPSTTPYDQWSTTKHTCGTSMVKTFDHKVLQTITPDTHPMIFNLVNRAQTVGWLINEDVYNIYSWALRNRTEAFSDIWELQNPEARQSKIRESKAIGDIAKRFIGSAFYHLYTLDFRGRKYCSTAYLHEQGSDLARGLLLRNDKKRVGEDGFFWLCISIASNWAGDANREDGLKTDKIPLTDRMHWVLDNEEILISYAENPKVNQGWMKADTPWQFIAACFELLKLRKWQEAHKLFCRSSDVDYDEYGYQSHLECFIDGSNNGSQHLAALTKDEVTAPHVNLVPSALPGDLYLYVAEHVWKEIDHMVEKMSKEDIAACNNVIDTIIDKKEQLAAVPPKSDRRTELIEELMEYKSDKTELIKQAGAVFWHRIRDRKSRRKITKRGVMTIAYGSTPYGMGQQIIEDAKKHGIPALLSMEHSWGSFMGRLIYEDCKVSLKRPTQLLSKFEQAGKKAEKEGRFLNWTVPVTNFPVVQHYTEGVIKKIHVQYGPPKGDKLTTGYYENTFYIAISFVEEVKISLRKQSQGAAPNAIHSLDAAHLTMVVNTADFPVTTIHDSFGCLLADMPELYKITRETFVELYKTDPLHKLMSDIGGDLDGIQLGTLNLEDVLESQYCFV